MVNSVLPALPYSDSYPTDSEANLLRAWVRELSQILMRSEPRFKVIMIRTVNPRGSFSPSLRRKPLSAGSVMSMKFLRHSAQKSKSLWPSSCFCSSVRRCLDWVTSNFPSPCTVTRHTRRFVPPVINWRRYGCFRKRNDPLVIKSRTQIKC